MNGERYLCTKGHHVVNLREDTDTCPAILPWPPTAESAPCGAQLQRYRALCQECGEELTAAAENETQ